MVVLELNQAGRLVQDLLVETVELLFKTLNLPLINLLLILILFLLVEL